MGTPMNDRVHRALDGELAREDLTSGERAQAAAVDAAADALRAGLDRMAPVDLDVAVMKRIRELGLEPLPTESAPAVVRLARSFWAPRELRLRLRPVYGMAAAAALIVLLVRPLVVTTSNQTVADTAAPAATPVYVQFRLEAGPARNVALAGTFSDWQPDHVLHETSPGVWTTVLSVAPGVHDYVFVVDGVEMVPDPFAPTVDDGFGGVNSRLTVLAPSRGL
jgi:hypothetical protein